MFDIDWNQILGDDKIYDANDCRNAAFQLLSSQILYETTSRHTASYRLIARYLSAFREIFDMIGVQIHLNQTYRYVAAVPMAAKMPDMRKSDAMLLLVLRKAYHEQASHGSLDRGEAVLGIDELQEIYRAETGQEIPAEIGALKTALAPMKACGAIKIRDAESDQPFDVVILPGIEALVNEGTLARLADFAAVPSASSAPSLISGALP
jgi:hypothetical protein